MTELVWALVGLFFTLAILSYLVADNPLYRIAVHLFVGVTAGYAVVLAWDTVLGPMLFAPLLQPSRADAGALGLVGALVAGGLGLLLPFKSLRIATHLGTLVVAVMVGVGAAVAVGGAVSGTLLPQANASMVSLLPRDASGFAWERALEGLFVVVGTLATLAFFTYTARVEPGAAPRRPALLRPAAGLGEIFIGVAFGVLYAGALAASLAVFAERTASIVTLFRQLGGGG